MLEPNNKTIHTILQAHEEVKLSCQFPGEKGNINIILYNRKYFCRMKKRHLIDMVIGQS